MRQMGSGIIIIRNLGMFGVCRPFYLKNSVVAVKTLIGSNVNVTNEKCMCTTTSGFDEDENKQKQNISRLPKYLHNRMEHVLNIAEIKFPSQETTRKHKIRKYAKYGQRSGVDPGFAWPTNEELNEIIEEEKEWEPSLKTLWAKIEEKKNIEAQERKIKEEHVAKQMGKMPQYIEQYKNRLQKVADLEAKQEAKRKLLLEEARDYFGYDLDPRDPRFTLMQEKKMEEEKLAKKLKKKQDKQARFAAMLENISDQPGKDKTSESVSEKKEAAKA